MLLPTPVNVRTIRVVAYLNGAFVGIPYDMREGQAPRDILPRYRDAWVWLGSPGWYGDMTKEQKALAVAVVPRDVSWYEGCFDVLKVPA